MELDIVDGVGLILLVYANNEAVRVFTILTRRAAPSVGHCYDRSSGIGAVMRREVNGRMARVFCSSARVLTWNPFESRPLHL
jgi:hypothetical protein